LHNIKVHVQHLAQSKTATHQIRHKLGNCACD
jgi:hypothetical protein